MLLVVATLILLTVFPLLTGLELSAPRLELICRTKSPLTTPNLPNVCRPAAKLFGYIVSMICQPPFSLPGKRWKQTLKNMMIVQITTCVSILTVL